LEQKEMNTYRKLRFPILIGAGVAAAGVLLYFSNARINSQHTLGAIGQREVYRDAQVNASDVKATPGTAPVATQVLLQSKEFKAIANNPAFAAVMSNASFQALSRNEAFLSALSNPSFAELVNNGLFAQYLKSDALANVVANVHADMAKADLTQAVQSSLLAAHAQSLASNSAFNMMMYNASFLSALHSESMKQNLVSLVSSNALASLAKDSLFQSLLQQSAFQNALLAGTSASLANASIAR
jgi:hypothetical protein